MSKEENNQLKITIHGYEVAITEVATKLVAEQFSKLGPVSVKPSHVRFPTEKKRVSVLISPHKHKRSQETFERRTHVRKIFIPISNISPADLERLEKELKSRVSSKIHLKFSLS